MGSWNFPVHDCGAHAAEGSGRILYLTSEWPKRRKLYRGQDNEAKPRSVSCTEGRGEARRMSKPRGWQTRGDGRGSRGPPSRTRLTFRDAVPYTPLCAPHFRQPASNTSRRLARRAAELGYRLELENTERELTHRQARLHRGSSRRRAVTTRNVQQAADR